MSDLAGYLKEFGAAESGTLSAECLDRFITPGARRKIENLCPGCAGILIGAFPYYAGERKGNLSVYSRGEDYHIAVKSLLTDACVSLGEKHPENRFLPLVDASPVPEVIAARLAGIGIAGEHGLIICPPYGSYVFLGCILTDLPLRSPAEQSLQCIRCGKCARACPSGALRWESGRAVFNSARCLSRLSQRRGILTKEEEKQLRNIPTVWGCDECQSACPYNRSPAVTALDALAGRTSRAPYIADLNVDRLEQMSEEEFQLQFGNRAFSWRGTSPLIRNLKLHKEKK